jgi:hypothetical protein
VSFEPVTYWKFRCDGDTTTGQCRIVFNVYGDGEWVDAETPAPSLDGWESTLEQAGWVIGAGGRLMCPAHVVAAERLIAASMDGLPFYDLIGGQQ